ncbi:hypothetical protein [Levilactobacillus fuyuanensis]|uniref:DUF2628 domain-containing protein n=1 Tax=Levilactobacillus fuyuanensis TaxID=2486022 RepID=A0ABW4H273_9LACO|nr:hypothetical protein [Levilactobacillus fuyuanensis]
MIQKILDIFKQEFFALNMRFWATRYAISIGTAIAWFYFGKQAFLGGQLPGYFIFFGIQAAIFYPIANGFLVIYEWEHGRQAKGIFDNYSEMQAADYRKAQFRAVRLVNSNFRNNDHSFGETKNAIKSDAAGMKMMFKFFGHVILWVLALFFTIVGIGRYLVTLKPENYSFNYSEDGTYTGDSNTEN